MQSLVLLAIRNVFRNKRRTVITELAIIFGAVIIILIGGISEFMVVSLREQTIRSRLGHLQIHSSGFSEMLAANKSLYKIEDSTHVIDIIKKEKNVESVTERIDFDGIVSTERTSTNFVAMGVNPETDTAINSYLKIVKGNKLSNDYDGGLVGKELAESLKIGVGDVLTLLTNTVNGSINATEIVVQGVFQTGASEYDKRALIINIKNARDLIYMPGTLTIAVFLGNS